MNALRHIPSLDLLRGFEAAARHLSFTLAADELHLTQSAVSRQVASLEKSIGAPLFVRRHRGLALTEAGQTLFRAVGSALGDIGGALARISGPTRNSLNVTASVSFCALWLVPRLPRFLANHPDVDVRLSATSRLLDLQRDQVQLAIRFCTPAAVPSGTPLLMPAEVVPVCAPRLLRDRSRPLRRVPDLSRHVLLHYDDKDRALPQLAWSSWLEAAGQPELRGAAALYFSHLDHSVRAAMDGQGVALAIRPVVQELIDSGRLVVPFSPAAESDRGYYLLVNPSAAARADVAEFAAWLMAEAAGHAGDVAPA